jgi:mannose-1-phosphate guanylyltransferase
MPDDDRLWAIVLAGGRGVRLRPLVQVIHGDVRPKQFAAIADSRSMLRHTLDRVALRIPPERTVVVVSQEDARYFGTEFGGASQPHVLVQPADRGTAAGVLLPAHWILWRAPAAVVAVFPSDQFVQGSAALMDHVVTLSRSRADSMVLLGAPPTDADPGYGWIEPGERFSTLGAPAWRVRRFWEKPSPAIAEAFFAAGHLWNTLMFVARVSDLVAVGRLCLPGLSACLDRIEPASGTDAEGRAIERAYGQAEPADFSRAVLEPCAAMLAVARLPASISWSDWGTPERVLRTLRQLDVAPGWLRRLDAAAGADGSGRQTPPARLALPWRDRDHGAAGQCCRPAEH